jgi:hypothetical protein
VARVGDSDRSDAPVERALVDGRLDAIETTRNRWCAPVVEVDLPPSLASTSAIGFSWRSDLLLVASVGNTFCGSRFCSVADWCSSETASVETAARAWGRDPKTSSVSVAAAEWGDEVVWCCCR